MKRDCSLQTEVNALLAAELNKEKNAGSGVNATAAVGEGEPEIGAFCVPHQNTSPKVNVSSTRTASLKGCGWFVRGLVL